MINSLRRAEAHRVSRIRDSSGLAAISSSTFSGDAALASRALSERRAAAGSPERAQARA
ncbi:MAG: hypothetical protein KC636_18045 [Myxococcales bacterium]|nr:hypothetical protein [Myxococcales bacterium]